MNLPFSFDVFMTMIIFLMTLNSSKGQPTIQNGYWVDDLDLTSDADSRDDVDNRINTYAGGRHRVLVTASSIDNVQVSCKYDL